MELTAKEEKLAKGMNEKKMGSYRVWRIWWGVIAIIFALILAMMMAGQQLHMDTSTTFWLFLCSALASYSYYSHEERYVRLTRKLLTEIERLEHNQKA